MLRFPSEVFLFPLFPCRRTILPQLLTKEERGIKILREKGEFFLPFLRTVSRNLNTNNYSLFYKEDMMKVIVDENLCTGCGLCVDVCPEVFEMPEALSIVKAVEITEDIEEKVREAAESCPVEAIIVEE